MSVAGAANAPDEVIGQFSLQHLSAETVAARLQTPQANKGLKEFVPDGVTSIVGLKGLNALLVKAKKQEVLDQIAQLITLLDQPVKSVVLTITQIKSTGASNEGIPLLIATPPAQTSLSLAKTGIAAQFADRATVDAAIAQAEREGRIVVENRKSIVVQEGDQAMANLMPWQTPFSALQIRAIAVHPDNTGSLEMELSCPSTKPAQNEASLGEIEERLTLGVRMKHEAVLVMHLPADTTAPEGPVRFCLLSLRCVTPDGAPKNTTTLPPVF